MADTLAKLAKHPAAYPEILATSSEKSEGIEEMRQAILHVLAE
jgi:GTP-binding protein